MSSQKEVARHLSLSQQAVSQLIASGVLNAPSGRGGMDLDQSRVAYIKHLREQAAGRAGNDAKLNLVDERARVARAQAIRLERTNAIEEERSIDMAEAADIFWQQARMTRDAWRAWPSRVAPLIAGGLGVQADLLLVALDEHVHEQLCDLGESDFFEVREQTGR